MGHRPGFAHGMTDGLESREHATDPVNWQRTDGGVEIYDERDGDAWVRMEFVGGIDPADRLFGICGECGLVTPQRSLPAARVTCGHCGAEFERDS